MEKPIVRILSAELNYFRNVEHGVIPFPSNIRDELFIQKADVLGIYGQNGSGKTAFIYALATLDNLLSGNRLPKDIYNFIHIDMNCCWLSFLFSLQDNDSLYKITYDFRLTKREKENENIFEDSEIVEEMSQIPVYVSHEKLSYSRFEDGNWTGTKVLIEFDADSEEIFTPKIKVKEILNKSQDAMDNLRVAKKLAIKQTTSFIFSTETLNTIRKSCKNEEIKMILFGISAFARENLYIIDNRNSGLIDANLVLPINFKAFELNAMGTIPIKLEKTTIVPVEVLEIIKNAFNTLNKVLQTIIPGLTVEVLETGQQMLKNNKMGISIELISNRDVKQVPFKYESDGIKKIVSVLHMLIFMYNNPSMTLAIDELDTGIFEYLLGEILKVIEETGKGQLIFTSHNLRPLEMLDKNSILFTTTNPQNRYIRFVNIRPNNNLRDKYFHDLILGGQKECIYEPTNSFEINRAFRKTGEVHES